MSTSGATRIAVLVSGGGTNLQAIIDRIEAGAIDGSIAVVVSNKADAYALTRAEKHGIPVAVLESGLYPDRSEYDGALVALLKRHEVSLVLLAGFMRILTGVVVDAFPNAIINIHPALLPSFPGLHAQRQALAYGVRFSGCTVHFVDSGTDTGPVILQAVVPVLDGDTEETLSARILAEEHRIFPEAVRLFCADRLSVSGRHVRISQ